VYFFVVVEMFFGWDDVILVGFDGEVIKVLIVVDIVGKFGNWYFDFFGNLFWLGCDFEWWFKMIVVGYLVMVYVYVVHEDDWIVL